MAEHPFDTLARCLGASRSRRGMLKQVGAALAGVLAASLLPRAADEPALAAAPCSPATCRQGCCDKGGHCVAGTATTTCGSQGAGCRTCARGERCEGGGCITAGGACNGA